MDFSPKSNIRLIGPFSSRLKNGKKHFSDNLRNNDNKNKDINKRRLLAKESINFLTNVVLSMVTPTSVDQSEVQITTHVEVHTDVASDYDPQNRSVTLKGKKTKKIDRVADVEAQPPTTNKKKKGIDPVVDVEAQPKTTNKKKKEIKPEGTGEGNTETLQKDSQKNKKRKKIKTGDKKGRKKQGKKTEEAYEPPSASEINENEIREPDSDDSSSTRGNTYQFFPYCCPNFRGPVIQISAGGVVMGRSAPMPSSANLDNEVSNQDINQRSDAPPPPTVANPYLSPTKDESGNLVLPEPEPKRKKKKCRCFRSFSDTLENTKMIRFIRKRCSKRKQRIAKNKEMDGASSLNKEMARASSLMTDNPPQLETSTSQL